MKITIQSVGPQGPEAITIESDNFDYVMECMAAMGYFVDIQEDDDTSSETVH